MPKLLVCVVVAVIPISVTFDVPVVVILEPSESRMPSFVEPAVSTAIPVIRMSPSTAETRTLVFSDTPVLSLVPPPPVPWMVILAEFAAVTWLLAIRTP